MVTKRKLGVGLLLAFVATLSVLGAQSRDLNTEIEIAASPQTVWEILTDLSQYEDWNPHITSAEGEISEGSKLTIEITESDGSTMTFRPTVIRVAPNTEFRWLGRLLVPRLFDGEHIFEISALGDNEVRLVHRDNFRGLLVLPFWNKLNTESRRGFEEMNAAIKERAEARDSGKR